MHNRDWEREKAERQEETDIRANKVAGEDDENDDAELEWDEFEDEGFIGEE
jgi:hypothetical protein